MWTVILSSRFKKSFKKIDKDYQSKIEKFILLLQNGFYPEGFDIKKLEGGENEYRCRIGVHRVLYKIEKNEIVICVLDVLPRKDAYK